jgi:NADH-quinone oxidoreductase subunit H
MSSLYIILFFGGWLPILNYSILYWIPGWLWFSVKVVFIMFAFVWVRATLPRYRFDQLMSLGWKVILPISLVFFMLFATGLLMYLPSVAEDENETLWLLFRLDDADDYL